MLVPGGGNQVRRVAALPALLAPLLLATLPAHAARPFDSALSPTRMDAVLAATLMPVRDTLALHARLVEHRVEPDAPAVFPETDFPLGSHRTFWIGDDTARGFHQTTAQLDARTAHAYFYIQDGKQVDLQQLRAAAQTFESHIYPTDQRNFGSLVAVPSDHEPHVTVFFGDLGAGTGGYFSAEDLLPRTVFPYSNETKLITTLYATAPDSVTSLYTLAHEFQHMIHRYLHPREDAWINEGSSMLAQELNGYGVFGDDIAAGQSAPLQLDAWSATVASSARYGAAYLWMLYCYERFGGQRFLHAMMADNRRSGMPLFDDVLAKLGIHETADDVFGDWMAANYVNDRSAGDGRYGYQHSQVHAHITASLIAPGTLSKALPQYAANYIDVKAAAGQVLTIHFSGAPTVQLLDSGTSATFWWSNRGDYADSMLTSPPVDLRGLHHATLSYRAFWDLEPSYDYAYLEASTDGGQTWATIPTLHTSNANPQGLNLGNGLTGASCPPGSARVGCWVDERADLTPFTGHQVLLRWEQATDDEYNAQGAAFAGARIPEANLSLDTLPGWQSAGWLRAANTLAQRWTLTALVYSAHGLQPHVVPVDADGQAGVQVPAGATHVVLCIAAEAPETTVGSSYQITVGAS